jgi:hypothetical protein
MFLAGMKTYLVALIVAAIAIVEGVFGFDIPGASVQSDWFMTLMAAFGLAALRNAVPVK